MATESKKWVIPLTLMLLLSSMILISSPGTDGAPEGYVTMDDLISQFPSAIVEVGDDHRIIANLQLPATKPLFLGPGDRVLFDEGIFLNMSGAPLFEGTLADPVYLGPYVEEEYWGGINLLEADISTPSIIKNITLEKAIIGIRSHNSDLHIYDSKIDNCSRNGLDIKGPIGNDNFINIERTNVINSTYYGIHLLKVEDARIASSTIMECGTGIRTYGSSLKIDGLEVLDSGNIGMNPVNSDIWAEQVSFVSISGSTSIQMLILNSTVQMFNSQISGARTGISIMTGSDVHLDGIRSDNIFTDGIQVREANLNMLNSEIDDSGESAFHLVDAIVTVSGTTMNNNGRGTGDFVFSTIYSEGSVAKFESCSFIGSGYAHVHSISSSITIGNSTLGAIFNEKLVLDEGSVLKLVNTIPPSDTSYLDDGSMLKYFLTITVDLIDYETSETVAGGQVDLRNVDGDWISSGYTGPDGETEPLLVLVLEKSSTVANSHLPITVIAQKDGYEVSTYDMEIHMQDISMKMYPPNDAPNIALIGPVNGTTATDNILIEGILTDDLGIFSLKIRFDEGQYRTFEDMQTDTGGHFDLTVPLGNLSGGLHTLWVHAFDHTHISPPDTRRIIVIDPRVNDSDEDGIPDIDEDVNGNGIVDEGETDPNNPDTDGDLIIDGIEIDESDGNSTDPLDPDSDGDYLTDGFEDQNQNGRVDDNETDPNDPDTDNDSVNDREDMYPLDPFRTRDITEDGDSTAVIILATIFIIALVVAVYLFIVKTKGSVRSAPVRHEDKTEPRHKSKEGRDTQERKKSGPPLR